MSNSLLTLHINEMIRAIAHIQTNKKAWQLSLVTRLLLLKDRSMYSNNVKINHIEGEFNSFIIEHNVNL